MRKILALVLTGALAIGMVSMASAGEEQQKEDFTISGKFSKKKFKNAELVNLITTSNAPGSTQPPDADRTVVDWGKQFKFNNKSWPTCKVDQAQIENTTTEQAIKACGKKSVVSDASGSSATISVGGVLQIDVLVTAFNAKNNVLLLHSKPIGDAAGIPPSILVGKLKNSKAGSKYGKALDVSIPELTAGGIAEFLVTIPKSEYVQIKCKPSKVYVQATTTFGDGTEQTSDTDMEKCN